MRIAFVSAMASHPWGGSELLWAGAAKHLSRLGHQVAACVPGWRPRPSAVDELRAQGIEVFERGDVTGLRAIARLARNRWGYQTPGAFGYERWLSRFKPDFVCVSNGNFKDGLWCMEFLTDQGIPFAPIVQANAEFLWPKDTEAGRLGKIYGRAAAVYFVSDRNRELLEKQLAMSLENAEVVRNPYNVERDEPPAWPASNVSFKLACVGRLEPDAKGQDILFEVLASEPWRSRPLTVSLFGNGNCVEGLKRLAQLMNLGDRVQFEDPVQDVASIWATHHALALPSRYEGLPLVLVEAALMSRMAIVTDVAGNCEIVQDGKNGFVAEAANSRSFGIAMERAWKHRDDWEKLGQEARRRIQELVPEDPCEEFAKTLLKRFGS